MNPYGTAKGADVQLRFDDYPQAARVATELVNTAPGVWNGTDQLPDIDALESFLDTHVTPTWDLGSAAARPVDGDLTATHGLRDALRRLIEAEDPHELVRQAGALTHAAGSLTLGTDDDRGGWRVLPRQDASLAGRLGLIAGVGALGTMNAHGGGRFRACASPTCSGVFIDTSRNGARRYCMPELCGNRANVANHRARRGEP